MRDRIARIARLQNAIALRQRDAAARLDAAEARLRAIGETERGLLTLAGTSLGGQTQFAGLLARQLGGLARERGDLAAARAALLARWQLDKAAERSAGAVSGKLHVEARRADAARSLADWLEPRLAPAAADRDAAELPGARAKRQ